MAITSKKLRKAAAQLMDTLSRVPEHELQNLLETLGQGAPEPEPVPEMIARRGRFLSSGTEPSHLLVREVLDCNVGGDEQGCGLHCQNCARDSSLEPCRHRVGCWLPGHTGDVSASRRSCSACIVIGFTMHSSKSDMEALPFRSECPVSAMMRAF